MTKPWVTHEELMELARRRSIVKWWPSGIIEQLKLNAPIYSCRVAARNIITGKIHAIWPKKRYFCIEVERTAMVTVGELLGNKHRRCS